MTFLHPAFLWGLTALAIPIVVHLFNFRRYRTLYFSNTQFLKELNEETRRQSQLKKWIILLLRMAAITAMVLAFAQPVPKTADSPFQHGNAFVQLYIDNSFSMENQAEQGSLLHEAAEKAKALADAFGDDAAFMLVTNDLESKHARFISRAEIKKEIDHLQVSPVSRSLKNIMQYAMAQINKVSSSNKQLFIFSDFQKSACNFSELPSDSNIKTFFIPLKANIGNNNFIDTCWFDTPVLALGQNANLSVILRNESDEEIEKLPVRLYVDNQQKAIASANIKAQGQALIHIPFTLDKEGNHEAYLIIDDYPITFDDQLFFSFQVTSKHAVLRIHDKIPDRFLQALFAPDSTIVYRQMSVHQMDYTLLAKQDLVILDQLEECGGGFAQAISQYVENGGNLLIIPSIQPQKAVDNPIHQTLNISRFTALDTHRCQLSDINMEHALYRNTFEKTDVNLQLPRIFRHYLTDNAIHNNKEILLRLDNKDELLSVQRAGKGSVYLLSVPLDDTFGEWQRHALFVPTLYNMAVLKYHRLQLYNIIGNTTPIPIYNDRLPSRAVPEIRGKNFSFIPEMRNQQNLCELFVHDQVQEAGNYLLIYQNDTLQHISFNYNRSESAMKFWNISDLKSLTPKNKNREVFASRQNSNSAFAQQLRQQNNPSVIFIWLALLFLLSEIILLRVWKM